MYTLKILSQVSDKVVATMQVLPTPLLIQQASRKPVEAYQTDSASDKYPPIWRMRDDDYDPPGTQYERVLIEYSDGSEIL
jgi:hypothetical protein